MPPRASLPAMVLLSLLGACAADDGPAEPPFPGEGPGAVICPWCGGMSLPVAVGFESTARVGWSNEPFRIEVTCAGGPCETGVRHGDGSGALEALDPAQAHERSKQVRVRALAPGPLAVTVDLVNDARHMRARLSLGSYDVYVVDALSGACTIYSEEGYFGCDVSTAPPGERRVVFAASSGGIPVAAPIEVSVDGAALGEGSGACGVETRLGLGVMAPATYCVVPAGAASVVGRYEGLEATVPLGG